MKTIAFAGSNSAQSINHQLVSYAASLVDNSKVIRLTDLDIPMYDIGIEQSTGMPEGINQLVSEIQNADLIIISVNEHNGNVSAYWKSVLDWLSRTDRKFLADKKVTLLSTSPGGGGAASARALMEKSLPFFGAELKGSMGVPSFGDNFQNGKLVNEELITELKGIL